VVPTNRYERNAMKSKAELSEGAATQCRRNDDAMPISCNPVGSASAQPLWAVALNLYITPARMPNRVTAPSCTASQMRSLP